MASPLPKVDRIGRPQQDPHKLFSHIGGINWLAEHIPPVQVPSEFWSLDASTKGEEVAIVACPCAHDHIVELLEAPATCAECEDDCGRYFAFTGRDVWCLNAKPELKSAEESAE